MPALVVWDPQAKEIRRYFKPRTVPLTLTHECEIIEEKMETTLAEILKFMRERPPKEFSCDPEDWKRGRNHSGTSRGDPPGAA